MAYNTNEDASKLLYPDFLNFYEQMALENPEMVRTNLQSVGLRADMYPAPKPGDHDDILNLRKSSKEMPRYKISNEARSFQTLLACLSLDKDTKKDAHELILQACTNERIMQDVLRVSPSIFDFDTVLEGDSVNEAVYKLTLIERLFYNSENSAFVSVDMDANAIAAQQELVDSWITRFFKSGSLNKLISLLEKVLAELKKNEKENLFNATQVLISTMGLVGVFVSTTVCSIRQDVNANMFSIKQTASALSKRLQQGKINAYVANKYLRRADKVEEDLEEKLEKACVVKSQVSAFFGASPLVKPKPPAPKQQSNAKAKEKDTFSPEDITEEMIFGSDVTFGGTEPVT